MKTKLNVCLLMIVTLILPTFAWAEIKLPSLVGDNMVLQHGEAVRVWGWADAGESVTVKIAGQTHSTKAGSDGKWALQLKPMKPGGPHTVVINDKMLKNVLIGEVWICSGQSNMNWAVRSSNNAAEEIANAKYPYIRLFQVPMTTAATPQDQVNAQWRECSPETISGFTAVGYFFGREIHRNREVPVGLIQTAWGGTRAEAWTSMKTLKSKPSIQPLLDNWEKLAKAYDPAKAKSQYEAAIAKWEVAAKKAKADGKRAPRKPRLAGAPILDRHHPSALYNAMIHPLTPMTVKGAIWYQGESNVPRAYQYRTIFPSMIKDWRAAFGNPDLHFGFVQLAPYRYGGKDPEMCAELWEAQLMTLKMLDKTGMAVTTDIGNIKDIHPKNKQDVGKRLGLWARATVYGEDIVYSGPIYRNMTIQGNKVTLEFDHVGGGLKSSDGKPLNHFTVAGRDRKFYPALAEIKGNVIVVSSDKVKAPVAVRFGWTDTAEPNFFNKNGLPASPFRTDAWPGKTLNNHY